MNHLIVKVAIAAIAVIALLVTVVKLRPKKVKNPNERIDRHGNKWLFVSRAKNGSSVMINSAGIRSVLSAKEMAAYGFPDNRAIPEKGEEMYDNEGNKWLYQYAGKGFFMFRDYQGKMKSLTIKEISALGFDALFKFQS